MKPQEISKIVDQLVYEALVSEKEMVDWCPEFHKLRKEENSAKTLERAMSTLILHNRNIKSIDYKFKKRYKNMKSLSLTGNLIERIDYLPATLEILHVNANNLNSFPEKLSGLPNILHIGLAFNSIQILGPVIPIHSLISLDLSHNQIYQINDLLNGLKGFKNLKSLNLIGNPICLLPRYPSSILQVLPLLRYFDGIEATQLKNSQTIETSEIITMNIKISQLTGIPANPVNILDDTGYFISLFLNDIPQNIITTASKNRSADGISFDHLQSISFPIDQLSIMKLKRGLTINLHCEKYAYEKNKEQAKNLKTDKDKGKKAAGKEEPGIPISNLVILRKVISTEIVSTCQLSLDIDGLAGGPKKADAEAAFDEKAKVGVTIFF